MKLKRKTGFSLIELMLVLTIMAGISFMKLQDVKTEQENLKASVISEHMKNIANATNAYINLHYNEISNLTNIPATSNNGPLACNTANSTCEITIKTLKNNALLPKEFNERSLLKTPYQIQLKRAGAAPNYTINGIIVSENKDRDSLYSGKILQHLGSDGGVSKGKSSVSGLYGGWKATATDYPILNNKDNMVSMLVGYSSNMYSIYLRRDGSLPMTGNLNLGNNSISNIKDLTSSGTFTGNIAKLTTLNATNATIATGAITTLNSTNATITTKLISNVSTDLKGVTNLTGTTTLNGQNTINGSYLNINTAATQFSKNVGITGTLNIKGATTFDGQTTFNNSILASSSTATIGNAIINNNLDVKGKATLNNEVSMNNNLVNIKDGNINAKNNINGNYFKPEAISVSGAVCQIDGTISRTNTGELLSCVSKKWTSVGGDGNGLGYGQNYSVFVWSRTNGDKLRKPDTDYVNTTGKPLFISIVSSFGEDQNGRSGFSTLLINGVAVDSGDKMYAVVPVGQRYHVKTEGKSKINRLVIRELR